MDAHKNFAISLVATAPSPATTDTTLIVSAGEGSKFPSPPFNVTVWPAGTNPSTANAEIVRVTAISTDTFTIVRQQEGTTARTIVVGDQIAATITAKTLNDVESPRVLENNIVVGANRCMIASGEIEVPAGNVLEVMAGGIVHVI